MKFPTAAVLVLIVLIVPSPATMAGPFGLDKGMTLAQIGGAPEKVAPGKWKVTTVPKPHSAFESYIVQVGPSAGLCWIKAIGTNIRTSAYGGEVRSQFSSLKDRLTATYGTSKDHDFLSPGSMWNEPRYWMMALLKKERYLVSLWDRENGATISDDLGSVGLIATAISTDRAFLAVEYSFSNESECDAEIARTEDDAL